MDKTGVSIKRLQECEWLLKTEQTHLSNNLRYILWDRTSAVPAMRGIQVAGLNAGFCSSGMSASQVLALRRLTRSLENPMIPKIGFDLSTG